MSTGLSHAACSLIKPHVPLQETPQLCQDAVINRKSYGCIANTEGKHTTGAQEVSPLLSWRWWPPFSGTHVVRP